MDYNDQIVFMSLELKYCERCGGLFTRLAGSRNDFCESCITLEQAFGVWKPVAKKLDAAESGWLGTAVAQLGADRASGSCVQGGLL